MTIQMKLLYLKHEIIKLSIILIIIITVIIVIIIIIIINYFNVFTF